MSAKESKPSPKEIIIDLSESQNADLFKGGDERLLQQTALYRVKEIIQELSKKVRKLKTDPPPKNNLVNTHRHDVITINGERGSGKTTFILNILNLIPDWHADKEIECSIKDLGIIDPTMIEDCEHIFLAVISKIKDKVENHWEDNRIGSNAETVDMRYQVWRTSLTKLAGGLRNLSTKKDTDGDSWTDPQFIMEEGLENSAQGVKLERHFHCFVEESLRFIEKDAFIIALDDVDTKVKTGWPVLEVLRKYLTTPYLIVILSGDIELYTQLIFNKQCEQIGVEPKKIIERQDIAGQRTLPPEYSVQRDLVNDLTEQYMMKIMRPDYRIEMQTVAQIAIQLKREGREIWVKYYKQKDKKEAKETINDILEKFCDGIYGFKSRQKKYLAQVLTEVPTRTCIQLLNTATNFPSDTPIIWKDIKKDHIEAVTGLGHVFQNALARAGLPSKLVNEVDAEHMTLGRLAMALHKENLLRQGVNLFPNFEKIWQRQLMMVLGAVYSRSLTTRLGMPFEYLVYMCLPAYLKGILDDNKESGLFKRYLEKSQLDTAFEAINTVKWGLRFILEDVKKNESEIDIAVQYCLVKADGLLPTISWHRYILNMASVFSETDGTTSRYISFHALLGAIATLAGSVNGPDDKDSVIEMMRQYGSEDNPIFDNSTSDDVSRDEEKDQKSQDNFGKLFARWCWWETPKHPAPLLALTESWNRFASATKQFKVKYTDDPIPPGMYLQDCIILYLSHLLEYEMNIMNTPITAKHAGNDSIEKRFANNLSFYKDYVRDNDERKCMIFEYVFSCPMWMHFLEFQGEEKSPRKTIIDYFIEKVSPKKEDGIDINDICECAGQSETETFKNLSKFLDSEPTTDAEPEEKAKEKPLVE